MAQALVSPTAYFCFFPQWGEPFTFAKRYITRVQRAAAGNEQRSSFRDNDIRRIGYTIRTGNYNEFNYLRKYIKDYRGAVWGVPLWNYEMVLTAAAIAGQPVLSVDETAYRELSNGDDIIIVSNYNTYETGVIQSFDASSITLTTNLTSTWALGKKVYPMLSAELTMTKFPFKIETPAYVTIQLEFTQSLRCA